MKTIPLTQGKVALVDDEDFELVNQYKWCAERRVNKAGRTRWYAARRDPTADCLTRMHNLIMGRKHVDHRNGDGLNNVRSNLRPCNHTQNLANCGPLGGRSRYKGVAWDNRRGMWVVQPGWKGKIRYIGHFVLEEDAAIAANVAYQIFHGEYAWLNDI